MIACVSAADNSLEESLNTLKWAHRARNISNRPEANRSATGANKQTALLSMQVGVGLCITRRREKLMSLLKRVPSVGCLFGIATQSHQHRLPMALWFGAV
jgi:hypothetical protein